MPFGFSIQSFKDAFFTSPAVAKLLAPQEKKALGRMGGYVRRTAKNSLRYRDGASQPGSPPHVHRYFTRQKTNRKTGEVKAQQVSPLRELIFYAFDASKRSTVVGPAIFGGASRKTKGSGPVPGILERGGTVTRVIETPVRKFGRKATPRQRESFLRLVKEYGYPRETRTTVVTKQIRPRPTMGPALTRSLPKFAGYFANTSGG